MDKALSNDDVSELRGRVCAGLSGQVLEVGFGSGLNVPYYPAAVTGVDAVEPSDLAWAMSQSRREASATPVGRSGLDGERLQAEDASYDAVLSTFTLCTIPDVDTALAEMARVLRPGGSVHVLEHGRAPDARVAAWQRRLDPVQQRVFGGCHLTRPVLELLRRAGLTVVEADESYLPGPAIGHPWSFGTLARARS